MRILLSFTAAVFVLSLRAEPEIKGSPAELANYLAAVPKTVSITGEAEVKLPADRAVISLTVATEAKQLQEAARANQELRARIVRSLTEQGLPADRIKASKFSSTPKYSVFKDKAKSYRVENKIKITVQDEKEFQAVAAQVDGSSEVSYGGVEFEHSDKEDLKAKAIARATDKAIEKKKLFEEKLGVKLSPKSVAEGASLARPKLMGELDGEPLLKTYTGVLTDPQFSVVVRALESAPPTFSELVYAAQVTVEYAVEKK